MKAVKKENKPSVPSTSGSKKPAGGLSYYKKKELQGWWFVSLFVIGLVIYYLPVLVNSIRFSFSDLDVGSRTLQVTFAGGKHYHYAFLEHPDFLKTLFSSMSGLLAEVLTVLIFSLFIASILNQRMHGRAFFRMIFFIPVVMTTGIVEKYEMGNLLMNQMTNVAEMGNTVAQSSLFDAKEFLLMLDIQNPTIVNAVSTLADGIYGIVQKSGVQIVIFLAGLQSISPSVYEVAKIEGASGWETFWKVTFPMMWPMIFVNTMYTIIDSFTRSSNAMVELIQTIGFKNNNLSAATAMSLVYSVVVLLFLGLTAWLFRILVFRKEERGRA